MNIREFNTTPRLAKVEQQEAKPSDTAENVKSEKRGLPDEVKLAILTTACTAHSMAFDRLWRESLDLAKKLNSERNCNESELSCMLRAYTSFAKTIASTTLQHLEQRKLLTVNGDREELILELSSSPIFTLGSSAMIEEMTKAWRE